MDNREVRDLAEKYGYLHETIERYIQIFGMKETTALLKGYEKKPKQSIRVNELKISKDELVERMLNKGFSFENVEWYNNGLIIEKSPFSLGSTTEYLSGYYFIQSIASWIPTLVLDPKPGETVVDLAAAPGGKATHIAQLMKNRGLLYCLDISRERIKSLRSNLARCGVLNSVCIRMDARKFSNYNLKVDKILLDAPCSGEGLMAIDASRRKSRNFEDIKRMSELQKELLSTSIKSLKRDGILIYSTCSTSPEENEEVIDWGLTNFPIKVENITLNDFSPGLIAAFDKQYNPDLKKAKRLYPHRDNTEGFFVCKIKLLKEVS